MKLLNISTYDYRELMPQSTETARLRYYQLMQNIIDATSVFEGSGVPTHVAVKHGWYFDTVTNKYYRNVDGGTTWVALN